jgi:hypothetical protein
MSNRFIVTHLFKYYILIIYQNFWTKWAVKVQGYIVFGVYLESQKYEKVNKTFMRSSFSVSQVRRWGFNFASRNVITSYSQLLSPEM